MRFLTTKNPDIAYILVPWYVPVNQSREDIFLETYERLKYTPDEMFVCLAVDNDVIKGMVMAFCRYNDVFLWQARSEGLARKYVDRAFDGLCLWAKSKGFDRIVTVPNRAAKLWQRRWGFKQQPNSNELYKEI